MTDTNPQYTEAQLAGMTLAQLKDVCTKMAARYGVPVTELVPNGARRQLIIDTILDCQEQAHGS